MNKKKVEINLEQIYSAGELHKMQLFGKKQYRSYILLVKNDKLGANILEAQAVGSRTGTRYLITGRNLIKYLKQKNHGNKPVNKRNSKRAS